MISIIEYIEMLLFRVSMQVKIEIANVSQFFECKAIIDNKCKINCEDKMSEM